MAAATKPTKRRKPARKAKSKPQPTAASAKPLPAPVEIHSVSPQPAQSASLFGLEKMFPSSSPENAAAYSQASETFSASEPAPGEPLNDEAERLLSDIPEAIGEAPRAGEKLDAEESAAAVGALGALSPDFLQGLIQFEEADVRGVLEEAFEHLAVKFDSEHWKLTDRQSRMLGKPTAQLLSSIWVKLSYLLPDKFAQLCASTPGLAGFVVTSAIVLGPKVAQQFAVSRQRRSAPAPVRRPGPGPVPVQRPPQGPIGPIDTAPPAPIATDHEYE